MENIGRAFSYMFEDKDWVQKILMGALFALLSLVLIGVPFLMGYLLVVARQSSEGRPVPLPNWDNLGDKFVQGLLLFIITVIYAIPGIILMLIPCIGILFYLLYEICFILALPYIVVRFARSGNFGDAFDFSGTLDFMKNNLSNLLIIFVMSIVLTIVAYFGLLALIIGIFFTLFWASLGVYYLYGQVVYTAEKGGTATPRTVSTGGSPSA
jgi:hypothetical protein